MYILNFSILCATAISHENPNFRKTSHVGKPTFLAELATFDFFLNFFLFSQELCKNDSLLGMLVEKSFFFSCPRPVTSISNCKSFVLQSFVTAQYVNPKQLISSEQAEVLSVTGVRTFTHRRKQLQTRKQFFPWRVKKILDYQSFLSVFSSFMR